MKLFLSCVSGEFQPYRPKLANHLGRGHAALSGLVIAYYDGCPLFPFFAFFPLSLCARRRGAFLLLTSWLF
jgi:hypothetical protein